MKILLIYPNINAQVGFNFGVAFISALLRKHGHTTRLINLNEKLARLPEDKEIQKIIEEFEPRLIGFSVVTPQYQYALKVAKLIKSFCDISIVCGGVHATMVPEEVIKEDCFDYVCVGEGEEAVLELASNLEKGADTKHIANIWSKDNGKTISNKVRPLPELSKLPRKDYDIFDFQDMINAEDGWVRLMTSRGCPFKCTYCFNHSIADRYKNETGRSFKDINYIRRHDVDEVIEEINFLLTNYKDITTFVFDDDIFTSNKTYLREFCDRYGNTVKIPFVVNAHARAFDEDRAKMLKEAGCIIVKFGLESGSERIRREILNRPMTNKEIIHAFECAHKYDLHTSAFVMFGLPHETKEDIFETIKLLGTIKPGRFRWSIFYPFPKTVAYEISKKGNFINFDKMKSLDNFTDDTCLDFGEEHNLFISRLQRTFPWYVNVYCNNSSNGIFPILTKMIEKIPSDAWEDVKDFIMPCDREISKQLVQSNTEHYTIKYNSFTAVNSKWDK
ncbi:MAG: B12-binding domain-containing radical SAM protein [Candidatus Scalinduaceae bacterium]